jgi:lipoprotein-anchoring transpeptidase ErfK/SrfK
MGSKLFTPPAPTDLDAPMITAGADLDPQDQVVRETSAVTPVASRVAVTPVQTPTAPPAPAPTPAGSSGLVRFTAAQAQAVKTLQSVDLWAHPMQLGDHSDAVARLKAGLDIVSPGLMLTSAYDAATKSFTPTYDAFTAAAVKAYQTDHKLPATGKMDARTYGVLYHDLFWNHHVEHELVDPSVYQNLPKNLKVDINVGPASKGGQRIRVLTTDGTLLREYPTSTGSAKFPTTKGHYKVGAVTERPSWNPPHSPWAQGSHHTPPGPKNPMGNVKMNLFGSVYMHGVPPSEYATIGKAPESHECMRMFQSDAWQLHEIVRPGTPVSIHS